MRLLLDQGLPRSAVHHLDNLRNVDAVVDGGVRAPFLTHHYYFGGPATLDGGGPVDSRATSSGSINI
jgi:hypothetical protein